MTPKRAHKSKSERKKLEKKSTAKIVGKGFLQRSAKPEVHGNAVKSQLVRVDAGFGKWLRTQAKLYGSITEVTRRLYHNEAVLTVMLSNAKTEEPAQ